MSKHLEDLKYFVSKDAPAETRWTYQCMVALWIITALLDIIAIAALIVVSKPTGYIPVIPAVIFTIMSIIFLAIAMKE